MGKARIDWGQLGLLAGLFVFVAIFWNTILVYPVKVFVVLLHELSHALAAILTGGHVLGITLSPQLGGVTQTVGGWPFLIASAGYLGSIVWGGLILFAAARSRNDRALAQVVGVIVVGATLLFTRNLFGLGFGILFGLGLIGIARRLPNAFSDLFLKFLGLTSCLYVVLDIKSDLIDRAFFSFPGAVSDAQNLAAMTGIPALVWGVAWFLVACAAVVLLLRAAVVAK
jgi:Peptidase M50B-like